MGYELKFTKEVIFGIILVGFLLFIGMLFLYEHYTSGFKDKNQKIQEISDHFGDKLTYKDLKKRCPECNNIDYYHVKKYI